MPLAAGAVAVFLDRLRSELPGLVMLSGAEVTEEYGRDEALTATPHPPAAVLMPASAEEVASVLRLATSLGMPLTTRGAGTGLAGGCNPPPGGVVLSTQRMRAILEVDTENMVAVVQPGVRLHELDEAISPHRLVYPVYPGEYSASIGGNVATNAGGMRAVKYGVTRHHVLGLQAVLASGEIIRTGGKYVKATSGYDLTQLLVGSEGTLAVVTEATLKLSPLPAHSAIALAPFASHAEVAQAVPAIVQSGIGPFMLEMVDAPTLYGLAAHVGVDLGLPESTKATAVSFLLIGLEEHNANRLDEDLHRLSELTVGLGAGDVFVVTGSRVKDLMDAREATFWLAKAMGVDDIFDVVVPRASIPEYLATVDALAREHGAFVGKVGHAGDGNIHISMLLKDPVAREAFTHELFAACDALGGAVSAEHGIGNEKVSSFLAHEDPVKVSLMKGIKAAFDPQGILNPGVLLGV